MDPIECTAKLGFIKLTAHGEKKWRRKRDRLSHRLKFSAVKTRRRQIELSPDSNALHRRDRCRREIKSTESVYNSIIDHRATPPPSDELINSCTACSFASPPHQYLALTHLLNDAIMEFNPLNR